MLQIVAKASNLSQNITVNYPKDRSLKTAWMEVTVKNKHGNGYQVSHDIALIFCTLSLE